LVGKFWSELALFPANGMPHAAPSAMEVKMQTDRMRLHFPTLILMATLFAQPSAAMPAQPGPQHDGAHDFDFLIGDWKAHLHRMIDRKTGVTTSDPRTGIWVEYDGICNDKKVLDTNANLEQFDVRASGTHLRFRGQALRMYNPASHQWSIYGIDLDKGELSLPPLVGQFAGRRGEFFDSELRNGRMVQVRYVWSDLTPKSARMEQSFSPDGGKSWAVNWVVDLSR
jgi:hypothetical protein